MDEMVRFVVDAFVAVMAVVDALVRVVTPLKVRFVVVALLGKRYANVLVE
jgi:hypothetical protein